MKQFNGVPSTKFSTEIIGKITKNRKFLLARTNYILVEKNATEKPLGFLAMLTSSQCCPAKRVVSEIQVADIESLNEGDVVRISPDGTVQVIWDTTSTHNCFLLTEACNCHCIMCPQPPTKDNNTQKVNKRIISLLNPDSVSNVCFTGGEPVLFSDRLIELLSITKKKFADANYSVLTNGILFADFTIAQQIAQAAPAKTIFCVSLHADVRQIHEKMNGANNSFGKVVKGIHNLAKLQQAIEIRPVITKINHNRLGSMAEYFYRNFPFAAHIAFMGMEIMGYAEENFDQIWIDPFEYSQNLSKAVWDLHRKGMNVSIFNIPLCLLPRESWCFARQSISEWKNDYLDICESCEVKAQCCGFFSTSGNNLSSYIQPVVRSAN